tara:strand:+ start:2197 stop:2886 length:690 start_codon:yes stop_codon:yes gene_type:complete
LNVLVVAAHPDDEILGMGGTILKHASRNDNVTIVYLATGITARKSSSKIKSTEDKKLQKDILELRQDALKAAKILKVKNVKFYDFPDNQMDSITLLKVVKAIEKEIKLVKPQRVYTNHYGDLNIDHKIVSNATITACRPLNGPVKEIFSFEVLSSTEWSIPYSFKPNYFVNIKKQLPKKIKAMEKFKGEIRDFPHPRSSKNMNYVAGRWGSVSGFEAAEAFEIIRKIED